MPSAEQANTPSDNNTASNGVNGNTSNGARRQLFPNDEVDEAVARQVEEILNRNAEEARERWNFDFQKDTPLEGEWAWEEVNV